MQGVCFGADETGELHAWSEKEITGTAFGAAAMSTDAEASLCAEDIKADAQEPVHVVNAIEGRTA